MNIIRKLFRPKPAPLPSMAPSLIALRRANARAYLRSRGLTRVKGLYGSPV